MAKTAIFAKMAELLGYLYLKNGCLNGLIRTLILTRIVGFPPFLVVTLNLIQEKMTKSATYFCRNFAKITVF